VRPLEKANLFHWKTNPNLNAVYVLVASWITCERQNSEKDKFLLKVLR
jgi:hypothetical protein